MIETEYFKAWDRFQWEFQSVPSDIKRYSHEQTDEVGMPTQSKFLADWEKRRGK